MDAREEIDGLLKHRPADHETLWPMSMDGCYGNPIDICETCGHQRQVHGHPDCDDLGSGPCSSMDWQLVSASEVALRALLPETLLDNPRTRVGETCHCTAFKGVKPRSRLADLIIQVNNTVD